MRSASDPMHPDPGVRDAAARHNNSELARARAELGKRMYERLRQDTSEHAIRASDEMLEWMCDITMGDPADLPVTTHSNLRSNWRHWERFCAAAGLDSPWRPDINALDATGSDREKAIWTSALIWIYCQMKPKPGNYILFGPYKGNLQPPKPESALAVLRGIRKEHLDRGITPPPLTLATRRMHEMTRRYAKWIGPENLAPHRKSTLTHEHICGMLGVEEGASVPHRRNAGGAPSGAARSAATTDDIDAGDNSARGREAWSWLTQFGRSYRALIHTLAQTGFRKAEVALGDEPWDIAHISFSNLKWLINGELDHAPKPEKLRKLGEGDFAVLVPPPSKTDQMAKKWGNHFIWLPFDAHAKINAAYALAQWELVARVEEGSRDFTPLFCGTSGVGSPLLQTTCDDVFQGLLAHHLKSKEDAKKFSVHSFRSHLASSMLAAGCSDAEIMAALRWSTLESLQVYKNANPAQYGEWLKKAERQRLTGMRLVNLAQEVGRPLPICDTLERVHAINAGRGASLHAAAVADLDVGSRLNAVVLEDRQEPAGRPMPNTPWETI